MKNKLVLSAFMLCSFVAQAQKLDYSILSISQELKENANSVVRLQQINVDIQSQKQITVAKKKVITVLNKYGLSNIDAVEYYDKSSRVNTIEAVVYDAFGKELKKLKRKDFRDQSVADGYSVYSDDRQIYLDYTPTEYPFTIVYDSETVSSNTAFIPGWYPIDDAFESIEKSSITVNYAPSLGFKYKEYNFENKNIVKSETTNSIKFSIENLVAERKEDLSPSYQKLFPIVLFGLEKFNLEGIEGNATTWKDFGQWIYTSFLSQNEELEPATQNAIKTLVGTETDPIKKAKIVYQYVQDKTRYVSIQLGIGGWKPMPAKDVDRLGYGDCKALSNYTRCLLKAVGVESYYTIIYGDNSKESLQQDFVSMQGNHAILAMPNDGKMLFLECTSQVAPFNFGGDFTDDRYALLVKANGGEIVKTNELLDSSNTQITKGTYSLNDDGTLAGTIKIKSKGTQYDNTYGIENKSKEIIDEHYKNHFNWINNLKLEKVKFINNKDEIEFTEELQVTAANYASKNGAIVMFPVNAFNQNSNIPQRYRNRKTPFEISRGYLDIDEIEVTIPDGYVVDAKPDNLEIKDKFGTYKIEIKSSSATKLIYSRSLLINKGFYDKLEYENYRKFREQIAKADNSKIVISKKA